ncbi:MAG: response regulator transcription factor [bacterium]
MARNAGVIDVLKLRPSMDDFAEYLTLTGLRDFGARSCAIAAVDSGGGLRMLGAFGPAAEDDERSRRLTVWDDDPLAVAILEGTCLLGMRERASDAGLRYVALPIAAPGRTYGGIIVDFDASSTLPARCIRHMRHVSDLLVLVWSFEPAHVARPPDGRARRALTSRQAAILRLIDDGLTNAGIARRIGFSESTVRQEIMAIFRALGARTRHEAVLLAQESGTLAALTG